MSDKEELKKALKAFKKKLRRMQQDDESTLSHGAMTGGRVSSIVGIRPPADFPAEIWSELVAAGRLKDEGQGTYSLIQNP